MLVLDCSAAVNIARKTEEGMRLREIVDQDTSVISSRLLYPETVNTFWKYARAGEITPEEAVARAENAIGLVDEFHDMEGYYVEALNEACRLGHPAYDFFYLLLAKRTGATLLTCDRKLASLAEEIGVRCAS